MNEEDFKALRNWLVEHGYYVGNHAVAEALSEKVDSLETRINALEQPTIELLEEAQPEEF